MLVENRWKVHPGMPMGKDLVGICLWETTLKCLFKKPEISWCCDSVIRGIR